MLDDGRTIVALATPEGRGGLAVVRVSGPGALAVARGLLPPETLADPVDSHRARLAVLRRPGLTHEDGRGVLDEALVLPMLAPASFTGEDTVEFFCHGGVMPARMVVAACVEAGARAASAGEFTRRAFIHGRLDLTAAEAVADLIAAEHALGARAALQQLRGGMQRHLATIEAPLRTLLADLEGSLEFADGEDLDPDSSMLRKIVDEALERLSTLLALGPQGRRLRDGIQVALVGPPNVGKSSLFNALLGQERVIVDAAPGTTRDTVSAELDLEDLRFVIHDTAGLRDNGDAIEAKGMARTRELLARVDIVLLLRGSDEPHPATLDGLDPDAQVLGVVTKADLLAGQPAVDGASLVTSSVTGAGLLDLRDALVRAARTGGLEEAASAGIMLNQRHRSRLRAARDGLMACREASDQGPEVVASLLAPVLQDLGQVSGRVFTEQMLGQIFSRFCVGK